MRYSKFYVNPQSIAISQINMRHGRWGENGAVYQAGIEGSWC